MFGFVISRQIGRKCQPDHSVLKNGYRTIILLILFVKFLKLSSPPQSSLPSYALKVSKDGKDYDEQVSANIKEGSETFHLREASSGKDAGDIIYDLKRVIITITLCVTFCTDRN